MQHHHSVDASGVFQGLSETGLGAELRAQLATQENVQAALAVDLSDTLQFGSGLVALTSERLLARAPGASAWAAPQRRASTS